MKAEMKLPMTDKIWIFQGNPIKYRIVDMLADDEVTNGFHWKVSRYTKDILKGHTGLIWLSGKKAGIYAVTEIMTDYPQLLFETDAEKKYWYRDEAEKGAVLRVKMKLIKSLVNNPLSKERIKRTEGFQNLSILKQPRGTNFTVSIDEWSKIKHLIEK